MSLFNEICNIAIVFALLSLPTLLIGVPAYFMGRAAERAAREDEDVTL